MRAWLRHIVVLAILATLSWFFATGREELHPLHLWNRTVADASYVLLCLTLMIGPAAKFVPWLRRFTSWRRELGIASAAGALLHVLALTGAYRWDFLFFFARGEAGAKSILTNMYGAANWIGLVALIYALILTLTSNDWAQKRLGKGWKFLQQQSYTLFVLALLHTALFITVLTKGDPGVFHPFFLVLTTLTVLLQFSGYFRTVRQQSRRRQTKSQT